MLAILNMAQSIPVPGSDLAPPAPCGRLLEPV